ncbi:MAG TPA: hypothetical protein VFX83_11075 [Azonexus sp.]|nr:hypothetical protein [Azonexus sp.]
MFGTEFPERFEREQTVSEADWLRCLPGAVRGHALALPAPGCALVGIGAGTLELAWTMLPPRRLGLLQLQRMAVSYRFVGVDGAARSDFMRYFDLYTQRGGG